MPQPPLLSIVGRKHAGKTTTAVRLAAALGARGVRVMTIKHGTHTFNLDPSNTDTYRHFHEGGAERVAMIAPDRFALVMRWPEEATPQEIAERHMGDADIVLCEGFKRHAIPKVEVFRRAAHERPLFGSGEIDDGQVVAMVTDAEDLTPPFPVFRFGDPAWLQQLADWVERHWVRRAPPERGG